MEPEVVRAGSQIKIPMTLVDPLFITRDLNPLLSLLPSFRLTSKLILRHIYSEILIFLYYLLKLFVQLFPGVFYLLFQTFYRSYQIKLV